LLIAFESIDDGHHRPLPSHSDNEKKSELEEEEVCMMVFLCAYFPMDDVPVP
jgi:hypothetical protein